MLNAGTLNRRVTIRQQSTVQDEIGQPMQAWTDVATVWANIRHPNGSESIQADRDVSIVRASIRIRRRTDVTAAMRVHHGAAVYEIKAVLPDEEDRDRIDLSCEVVNG
jgi:SPP1 family predicted phage head-tail adaptor